LRVGRYLLALLGLLIALYSLIVFPGQRHTPKLGIDLVGGLRVVFTALTPAGAPPPSSDQMGQARQIMEDRINTYGVTGATVVVQGNNQLVIEIPSGTGADVNQLGKAALLNFRGLMAAPQQITCSNAANAPAPSLTPPTASGSATPTSAGSGSTTPSGSASGTKSKSTSDLRNRLLTAPSGSSTPKPSGSTTPKASGSTTPKASGSATGSTAPAVAHCLKDPFAVLISADPSLKTLLTQRVGNTGALNAETCPSPAMPTLDGKTVPCQAYTALSSTQQQEISAALRNYDCSAAQNEADLPYSFYIACDTTQSVAYLFGHVVVPGTQIGSANAQAPNVGGTGGSTQWTVALKLKGSGADKWHAWTSKFHTSDTNQGTSPTSCGSTSGGLACSTWVGFTLDGQAISVPISLAVLDVNTSISGNFSQSSANQLAKELNYGKLPLNFRAEAIQHVSATLGDQQLKAAFLAGGIGLGLVVLYSLLYYRALGLVTIASLVVSAVLTYAMLVILSKQIGFTLDLAGIAGFIVALGITADSFVVFFERMKDEVHEGRSLRVAVPRAWVRARRTILSADTVSFLAAAILYYFASANVKGFAFTLGMSTILDLVVVFLFTHPMVSLLSRLRAFGSPRFTGLASVREGGIATVDADDQLPTRRRFVRPRGATSVQEEETASAVAVLDQEAEAPESEEPQPPRERRHTTPEAGTAAERAAARRARMREQGRGKEER
jgi:preprotein translocase subunit SecD